MECPPMYSRHPRSGSEFHAGDQASWMIAAQHAPAACAMILNDIAERELGFPKWD